MIFSLIHGISIFLLQLRQPHQEWFAPALLPFINPIKNLSTPRILGTFSIPISRDPPANGTGVYHIPTNDHDGTLRSQMSHADW